MKWYKWETQGEFLGYTSGFVQAEEINGAKNKVLNFLIESEQLPSDSSKFTNGNKVRQQIDVWEYKDRFQVAEFGILQN